MRENTVKYISVLSIFIFSQCVKVTILFFQIKFVREGFGSADWLGLGAVICILCCYKHVSLVLTTGILASANLVTGNQWGLEKYVDYAICLTQEDSQNQDFPQP